MSNTAYRIGLTMRTQQAEGYYEPRDALAQAWAHFLQVALPDAQWMYLPSLGDNRIKSYCENWHVNGLILTGGEDVGDSPLRDETERTLLSWAENKALPVLGICRGLQLMTIAAAGTLNPIDGHIRARHRLQGVYNHEVNSYHAMCLAGCPQGYKVMARGDDGSIEAIRHVRLNWEGWMWHPEREENFSKHDIDAIRRIFR